MIETSKILKVSYGNFSCTLEGFDNPFEMMKMIADHFRDLAAEDRDFGAIPPAPDAKMLARIAESGTLGDVDAAMVDSDIVLRAGTATDVSTDEADAAEDEHTETEDAATADLSEGTAESDVEETRETVLSSTLATEGLVPENVDGSEDEDGEDALADQDADSMSAKLQRIRDVVDDSAVDEDTPSDDLTEEFLPETDTPNVADADADTDEDEDRPHVVRMKRAEFEKAQAETDLAEADTQDDDDQDSTDFGVLDGAEDLDDYLEDSDFTGDMPDDEVAGADPNILADDDTADESDAPVDDEAMDRLLSQADEKMQEPEGSRRRDAIAQLKAAVAAKEAERKVEPEDDDTQEVEDAFRSDLSDVVEPVVTPRGSRSSRVRTTMLTEEQVAERILTSPLKLVAEQRVEDKDDTDVQAGVQTSERSRQANEKPAAGSFAEFAETVGAEDLGELLEAAAAYTSFVEGASEFSRPQILRQVRAVATDDFKREDELRVFAELINKGRFTKVRNGRFQVADDSRYNPERRAG